MPIERELKFRLAPRAARRAAQVLALGRGIALSSIYFDTPSRELSRARAALRLRRVGGTWLQAFKCEHAPGARGEWETPAPRGELDLARLPGEEIGVELAALKRRLRPLFETRFTRRAADVRFRDATVEVALDRGAIVAGRNREPLLELEIELKSGRAGRMLRYAQSLVEPLELRLSLASKAERGYRLALGSAVEPRKWRRPELRDVAPHEALARLASVAFEQIVANAEGMAASNDPEYLHQLRVGLRRLRAMFTAFRALEPKSKEIRRRLRKLGPVLGRARDWDVVAPSSPAAREARRTARVLVASPAFNETLVGILRWIDEAPWRRTACPLAEFAARALDRLHRKALKNIDWANAAQRHRLRIRLKRLRYAADAFADSFPGSSGYMASLGRLQDVFGELNDIAIARRLTGVGQPREARLIARARRGWEAFAKRPPFWRAGK